MPAGRDRKGQINRYLYFEPLRFSLQTLREKAVIMQIREKSNIRIFKKVLWININNPWR